MNILFIAAEASPLVKVGGLADVIGSLPKALNNLGHDVRIMLPKYCGIDVEAYDFSPLLNNIHISFPRNDLQLNVISVEVNSELKFYLIENREYFDIEDIYGGDDLKRFIFFDKCVAEVIPLLDWKPDVIHCHDWHTGFIPHWLKKSGWKMPIIFTIHNLNYQGAFGEEFVAEFG
jgi:starch synthase